MAYSDEQRPIQQDDFSGVNPPMLRIPGVRRDVLENAAKFNVPLQIHAENKRHREAVHAIRAGAAEGMPPLHSDCVALMMEGIVPQWVVKLARHLNNETLLMQSFKTMPASMRETLMAGTKVIALTKDGWAVKDKE